MKKLSSNSDNWAVIGAINDLIDKVRALDKVITRDIVRVATDDIIEELSEDYYRTITLRIPRDKTIAEAVAWALFRFEKDEDITGPASKSDTDLQKALDEVEHE